MILVLFTVPFCHFLSLRYLVLAEHHFLPDILVPFPDLCNLFSHVLGVKIVDYLQILTLVDLFSIVCIVKNVTSLIF